MKLIWIPGIVFILVAMLLAACAPVAAPASPPPAPAPVAPSAAPAPKSPVAAAPVKPSWETAWEQVVDAAKREGGLTLYTELGGEQRQIVTKPFHSKYGVGIESVSGVAALLAPKLFAEQRAGIYSGDVWLAGSTSFVTLGEAGVSLDPVLVLPELTEPELIKKTWYFGQLPWANKAHTMIIGLMDFKQPLSTNINMVKSGEITAYRDLLDPKWKGLISINDPRVRGNGNWWVTAVMEMGDLDASFMRDLATKQELFLTRDVRLQVEWLARGKHAIAIGPHTATVTEFIGLGSPINRINLGTPSIAGSTSGIAMVRRAPHSNAGKLFINWLLSQEGGTSLSKAVGIQSQRLDVPTAHLDAAKVLKPGLKIYNADNEDFATKKDTYYIKLANEIFGP